MTTTKHKDVYDALHSAQQNFLPLKKSGKNPHFGQNYSTLDDIKTATKAALASAGLLLSSRLVVNDADHSALVTALVHKDSQTSIESFCFIANDSPQKVGAAVTYARRYNIAALLDIVADPDDDAESYYGRGSSKSNSAGGTAKRRTMGGNKLS